MKLLACLALFAATSAPLSASDLVITKDKHTDAGSVMGQDQPAKDTREVTWVGTDRLRVEEGTTVTILRSDLKKIYFLDTAAKTVSTLELPFDVKKYVPAEMAPMMEQMTSQVKVTVTPTTETRQIQAWSTTKYTLTMTMPMGSMSSDLWVTKDVAADRPSLRALHAELMAASPMGAGIAAEMKKMDGLPILTERVQKMMNSSIKSTETVISIEEKEPVAGLYEVPEGYTEKPYDPMGGMGGPSARQR